MDITTRDTALAELLATLDQDAPDGLSVVLYGSAARGDWDAARSDLNLLLVLEDASPASLQRLMPAVRRWHEAGFTAPLIIGRDEWVRAADVFPVEITDMSLAYQVLRGDDPVVPLSVDPADLRRAVETALRGKLIRLRQAYTRFGEAMPTLGGFAMATASELLVLLRCLAVLKRRDPGHTPVAAITALSDALGPAEAVLHEVVSHRRDPEWHCTPAIFAAYLDAVHRLVEIVDQHQPGAA